MNALEVGAGPLAVRRVTLTVRRSLPVFPG